MDANIEALYYVCIDRIDDENLELAEEYLIGCITFLHRQANGRADRDRIKEDFDLDRGVEKYEDELIIISRMRDETLRTLIASSLDLSSYVDMLTDVHDKINGAVYDKVQAYNQTAKIRKAIKILESMELIINDKGNYIQPSLFSEED